MVVTLMVAHWQCHATCLLPTLVSMPVGHGSVKASPWSGWSATGRRTAAVDTKVQTPKEPHVEKHRPVAMWVTQRLFK